MYNFYSKAKLWFFEHPIFITFVILIHGTHVIFGILNEKIYLLIIITAFLSASDEGSITGNVYTSGGEPHETVFI